MNLHDTAPPKIAGLIVGLFLLAFLSVKGCEGYTAHAHSEMIYNRLVQTRATQWATENPQYQIITNSVFCEPRWLGNRMASDDTICTMRTTAGFGLSARCFLYTCRLSTAQVYNQ